jgi:phage shock protein A
MANLASLWETINQKLHAIVDQALQQHSLALYDQYIRDVEAYRRQVEESAAMLYAGIQANRRRLEQHQATSASLDARLNRLLVQGDQDAARLAQIDLQVQQELVNTTQAQIAHQEEDYHRLLAGRQETQDRLTVSQAERPAVENLMAVIQATRLMEQIELTLAGLAGLGEGSAAGQMAAGLLQRFDAAEARWQMAASRIGIDAVAQQVEQAQIDDQLAERIRRLGLDRE